MAQAPPCPYCGASSYTLRERRWLTCTSCGQEFDARTDVCTRCGRLNSAEARVCAYCASPLPKDEVDRIIEERSRDRTEWTQERTQIAAQQKRAEEEASRRRMEAYWEAESARRAAVAQAAAEQSQRQRRLLILVGVLTALFVLCLIALSLVFSQGLGNKASCLPITPAAPGVARLFLANLLTSMQ